MTDVSPVAASEVVIRGERLTAMPDNLYIPPDALRVFLEAFQGPLDLLLYLIKKENIDILDIPIVEITRQYLSYIELMQGMRFELAAEYLVMAAMLAEIKSRMLLPKPPSLEEASEEDPRAELVRRLQEYERYKQAAMSIDQLPRIERDIYIAEAETPPLEYNVPLPHVDLSGLLKALATTLQRSQWHRKHHIVREPLSIRERMSIVLTKVNAEEFTPFTTLFTAVEGRMGVVVTLIAILELIRQSVLELVQAEPYALIYIRAKG